MLMKDVLSWMRRIVEAVSQMDEPELTSVIVEIAGITIKIFSNDKSLLSEYRSRWFGDISEHTPSAHIYVLEGTRHLQTFPQFSTTELPPALFHEVLAAEGFMATYPSNEGQVQLMDCSKRIAVQLFSNRANLPPWEASAPLRMPLQWILAKGGLRLAHAATVGFDGKGLVLFGKGGSGKSGTTLAGLAVGMNTVGDDYIALGVDNQPFARAVFNHVKQDEEGVGRIPGLRNRLGDKVKNWRGKFEFQPETIFKDSFVKEMHLYGALLPTIAHQLKPDITQVSPAEVLLALINSNAQYDPARPDGGLRFFANILRKLPCYRINLSDHAIDNAMALKALIADLK